MTFTKLTRRSALQTLAGAPLLAQVTPPPPQPPQPVTRAGAQGPQNVPGVVTNGWVENPPHNGKKILIAWGDNRNAVLPHSAVSHAMAVMERIGYESGLWDTYIRSDSDMIIDGPPKVQGQLTLDDADAIFFMGHRNIDLSAKQKSDLLSFVHDRGKGFVAAHGALTAFSGMWPEFVDMIGGFFDGHPWDGKASVGHLINEAPDFPATHHFPPEFDFDDEYYMVSKFDRKKSRVLLRMSLSSLPAQNFYKGDGDFPVAWAKDYGKGRVFYSSFSHYMEGFDRTDVQRMYVEAIKWAMGLVPGDATPRPLPKA